MVPSNLVGDGEDQGEASAGGSATPPPRQSPAAAASPSEPVRARRVAGADDQRPHVRVPPVWGGPALWPPPDPGAAVFVHQVVVAEEAPAWLRDRTVYLFAARESFGAVGYRMHYHVVDVARRTGTATTHHLAQRGGGVTYCAKDDPGAREQVDAMQPEDYVCLGRRPRWRRSEAQWPLHHGERMTFLAQVYLPRNAVTESLATWGNMLFLFAARGPDAPVSYSISVTTPSAPSVEQHYLAEELLAAFQASPTDEAVLERVVRRGDGSVHEQLLAQRRLCRSALELLAAHGTSKAIRAAALARLR